MGAANGPGLRVLHLRVMVAVTIATSTIVAATSWAIWLIERGAADSNIRNYPDALWWAMETVTTVGYGDHHPVTTGGRFVASFLMVTGLALVGVITATVVAWFFAELDLLRRMREIESVERAEDAILEQLLARLDSIEEQLKSR